MGRGRVERRSASRGGEGGAAAAGGADGVAPLVARAAGADGAEGDAGTDVGYPAGRPSGEFGSRIRGSCHAHRFLLCGKGGTEGWDWS